MSDNTQTNDNPSANDSELLRPSGSRNFFVFREKCGRLRCLSNARWWIAHSEVIAWADTLQQGRKIIADIKRKESELAFENSGVRCHSDSGTNKEWEKMLNDKNDR